MANTKKNRVMVNLTDQELVKLKNRASDMSLSLSSYIRMKLFKPSSAKRKGASKSLVNENTDVANQIFLSDLKDALSPLNEKGFFDFSKLTAFKQKYNL